MLHYKDTAGTVRYLYPNSADFIANQTTAYSNRYYLFMSKDLWYLYGLQPWFERYDATNNLFGFNTPIDLSGEAMVLGVSILIRLRVLRLFLLTVQEYLK